MAGNQAINVNPSDVGISLTSHGSDWLWTVFSIFGLTALCHAGLSVWNYHRGEKPKSWLHVGPLCATAVMAYAYFTTSSNLGWTGVPVEFNHIQIGDDSRQIFYARYIGWFLAFPALLYQFEFNATAQNGISKYNFLEVFHNMVLQLTSTWVFVLGLLIGSLVQSSYKWGYWTFGVTAQLFALGLLLARQLFGTSKATSTFNIVSMSLYAITFILYPVCWGLSEGGNVIQPDSEAVFYGVLDLIVFFVLPWLTIVDAAKNGSFLDDVASTTPVNNDVEKNAESPELRASGETHVPVQA